MVLPNKKRKQQSATGPNAKRSKGGKQSAAHYRVEDAGSLAWQTFGEEFGGLEVIEGVQVVKEGDRVSFLVAADTPAGEAAVAKDQEDNGDDGEVFEGFSDGDDDLNTKNKHTNTTDETKNAQDAKKKSEKKTKKKAEPNAQDLKLETHTSKKQKGSSAQTNSFGALMDANDDDDNGLNLEAWVALNLSPGMVSAVGKLGFARPTAIQEQSIPHIAAGGDVIGKAQTGSGKTLAFGIPIVERWLELRDDDNDDNEKKAEEEEEEDEGGLRSPTAVILSPTRELAKQIGDHIKALCDGLPSAAPYVCVVTGGLSIQKQQRQLTKADIVVGTPGRLWEVLDGDARLQRAFSRVRFLVVDEADRLFKVGQFKEAELIIGALDRRDPEAESDDEEEEDDDDEDEEGRLPRQTLVFSATFDKDLQTKLAGKKRPSAQGSTDEEKMAYLMKSLKFRGQPKFIDVNPVSQMAEGLREGLIECGAMEKDLYLYSVLLLNPGRRTLVFANSISAVRRVTPFLQNLNIAAQPLHSQMAQKARLRSLERFTSGPAGPVLVATDVAARGLDIPEVDVVVHYHVPRTADTYVHRSGRTARGARAGVSVMLCAPDEVLPTRRLAGKVHASRRGGSTKREHMIETLPLDKKVASRLKPRADMAKKLADAALAKERARGEDAWLRGAADDLGVEYDSEEFDAGNGGFRGGRGGGRKRKDKEAAELSKAEMGALRAQLREDLARRVNLGVSERYIAGGRVDVAKLIREKEKASVGGLFLGGDDSFGLGFGVKL